MDLAFWSEGNSILVGRISRFFPIELSFVPKESRFQSKESPFLSTELPFYSERFSGLLRRVGARNAPPPLCSEHAASTKQELDTGEQTGRPFAEGLARDFLEAAGGKCGEHFGIELL